MARIIKDKYIFARTKVTDIERREVDIFLMF